MNEPTDANNQQKMVAIIREIVVFLCWYLRSWSNDPRHSGISASCDAFARPRPSCAE